MTKCEIAKKVKGFAFDKLLACRSAQPQSCFTLIEFQIMSLLNTSG